MVCSPWSLRPRRVSSELLAKFSLEFNVNKFDISRSYDCRNEVRFAGWKKDVKGSPKSIYKRGWSSILFSYFSNFGKLISDLKTIPENPEVAIKSRKIL